MFSPLLRQISLVLEKKKTSAVMENKYLLEGK
jgi:hypothetical protein